MNKKAIFISFLAVLSICLVLSTGAETDRITATRSMETTVSAGSANQVILTFHANDDNVQAPTLDEELPSGWTIDEVTYNDAINKPSTDEWIWNKSLSTGDSEVVTYMVNIPSNTKPQDYPISGKAYAYGIDAVDAVIFTTVLTVTRNCGDVDATDGLDVRDAAHLARYIAEIQNYDTLNGQSGDVDGNTGLDVRDAAHLARFIAEIPGYEELYCS